MSAKLTIPPQFGASKWFNKASPDWKFRREFPATSPMKGPNEINPWEKLLGHSLKRK